MSGDQLPSVPHSSSGEVTQSQAISVKVNQPSSNEDDDVGIAAVPSRLLFNPPIDIYQNDAGLVLMADLPGVTIETLELQIQDAKLILFARVQKVPPPDAIPLYQEYQVGDFLRSFILTEEIDYERITAKLNHGVLEIVLPKASKAPPRKIEVRTE
ncbi:Hsp20/alpha crystallin family protein [Lacunimicrobium album]|jgi:HSP20 family protein